MYILGIETSCDETAAAIAKGDGDRVEIISNVVASQIEIHKKYGGVVPEVAAREHVLNILPVVNEVLEKADILHCISPLTKGRCPQGRGVDVIAVTAGPGLITSLMVGLETAKTLAYAWDLPVVGVNHIEGHIYANFIEQDKEIEYPAVILTVSGGHTSLVLMHGHGKYEIIGETRDDAAGEAFDKAAKVLGLGYPGGPEISKAAEKCENTDIIFPRPMINDDNFEFSFSGLKTSVLYKIKKDPDYKKRIPEYAYAFEQAAVDVLVTKAVKAAKKYNAKTVMLSGGVAANKVLRSELEKAVKEKLPDVSFIMPELKYTTDNAAMIAAAGYFHARDKDFTLWQDLRVDCNLSL